MAMVICQTSQLFIWIFCNIHMTRWRQMLTAQLPDPWWILSHVSHHWLFRGFALHIYASWLLEYDIQALTTTRHKKIRLTHVPQACAPFTVWHTIQRLTCYPAGNTSSIGWRAMQSSMCGSHGLSARRTKSGRPKDSKPAWGAGAGGPQDF